MSVVNDELRVLENLKLELEVMTFAGARVASGHANLDSINMATKIDALVEMILESGISERYIEDLGSSNIYLRGSLKDMNQDGKILARNKKLLDIPKNLNLTDPNL